MLNWAIQPLAALMVGMAVPKLLLSMAWTRGSCYFGRWLEWCMSGIVGLARWGGQEAFCVNSMELPFEESCLFVVLMVAVLAGYQFRRLRLTGMVIISMIVMGVLGYRPEIAPEIKMFRAEKGTWTSIVVLSQGRRRANVLATGCEESARMAMEWMKQNGVGKVEKIYVGNGTGGRKGLQEWMRGMTLEAVVMNVEWRNAEETAWLMAEGIHVGFYEKTEAGYRYCHGGETCLMKCMADEISFRYENACNGMRMHYDKGKEGIELFSFIYKKGGGGLILMPGSPSKMVRLSMR